MNNQYPYYQQPQVPNGFNYATPRPMAKNTQPLTQDEIDRLRRKTDELSLVIPEEDLMKCACTHKEKNGANTLIENADGTFTCTICKETFKPFDGDLEGVKKAVELLISMLQTTKMIYLDASDEMVRQYFQIIPLLQKFPRLWEVAVNNFSKYDGYDANPVNNYGGFGSGFVAMNQLLTNPYAGFMMQQPNPYYQQQMMYQPQPMQAPQGQYVAGPQFVQPQQMVYQPQPMQAPQGQYVDPNNPMAYGVPAQAPQAPAPGVMPQAPAADPASQQGEVQQQKTFNV